MQAAGRRVAYHTFSHVLDLDTGFHLERRTGALSRILERGTRTTLLTPHADLHYLHGDMVGVLAVLLKISLLGRQELPPHLPSLCWKALLLSLLLWWEL